MACLCYCSKNIQKMTVIVIVPTLNLNFFNGVRKLCLSFYGYGYQESHSVPILPVCSHVANISGIPVVAKAFIFAALSKLSVSKLCLSYGFFLSVKAQWHFIADVHLLLKDVFLASILLSQSLSHNVITGQYFTSALPCIRT